MGRIAFSYITKMDNCASSPSAADSSALVLELHSCPEDRIAQKASEEKQHQCQKRLVRYFVSHCFLMVSLPVLP